MKPHKHAELIKAWADGAEIQEYIRPISSNWEFEWTDNPNPTWERDNEYRIKPREFEEGAFYPVLDELGDKDMACYSYGNFYLTGETEPSCLEDLTWIGEPLNIAWPEEAE